MQSCTGLIHVFHLLWLWLTWYRFDAQYHNAVKCPWTEEQLMLKALIKVESHLQFQPDPVVKNR